MSLSRRRSTRKFKEGAMRRLELGHRWQKWHGHVKSMPTFCDAGVVWKSSES